MISDVEEFIIVYLSLLRIDEVAFFQSRLKILMISTIQT